ncbi:MAG TPA: PEGA domain-containing protein, partial [Kofleriaceae bacterium]|nr:PEGA domain-containing protein [Kofleriaceae bacterium]
APVAPAAAPVADAAPAAPEPPTMAVLDITTRPAGAKVALGDRTDPKSPAHFADVAPGEHTVTVRLKGYESLARKIDLAAGEHRSLELDLVPTKATARALDRKRKSTEKRAAVPKTRGVLNVRTRPYSEVFLGDRRLGQTPFLTRLDAGRYTLLFKHPGKPTQKRTVTVKSGETTKLDFSL